MFNKAQLAERGRHYFDDSKIIRMYATTDGNFFYQKDKSFADSHSKNLKTSVMEITRADLVEEKPQKKEKAKAEPKVDLEVSDNGGEESKELSIEELRVEGKRLKIPKYWVIKEEKLKKLIAEANGTS